MQQTDTCVAAVYSATRLLYKSMDVILCVLGTYHFSHKRETQVRKGFTSFLSLNL